MAQCWENVMPEEIEQIESHEKWASGQAAIGKALSALLQQAWLTSMHPVVSLNFFHLLGTNLTKLL